MLARQAAKTYNPRRKPWVAGETQESPRGAEEKQRYPHRRDGTPSRSYFLHQAFPDRIGPEYTLDGLDYAPGRHPVSNAGSDPLIPVDHILVFVPQVLRMEAMAFVLFLKKTFKE
jgi:hypothetical protein